MLVTLIKSDSYKMTNDRTLRSSGTGSGRSSGSRSTSNTGSIYSSTTIVRSYSTNGAAYFGFGYYPLATYYAYAYYGNGQMTCYPEDK